MNTFTNREWGDGKESPALFNPSALDTRQWVRTAKAAGFGYAILTAKHHDGFCLWPTRTTEHSVKNSPWKNGSGDVVREFAESCQSENMKLGLYLSPWDRNASSYGTPDYNRFYVEQLTELLTQYGEVAEVWFDGANGEGPNGKKQVYDWDAFYRTVRKFQPRALIAVSGPDVRWVGNEDGLAHETEWSVQTPDPVKHKNATGPVWWPAECDTSIRPGWFWHRAEDEKVKTLSQLMTIYYASVGRNSVLLLNVPPNDAGQLSAPDVRRLTEFRAERDRIFANNLTRTARATASSHETGHNAAAALRENAADTYWQPQIGDNAPSLTIAWTTPRTISTSVLQENIAQGQRIAAYHIDALTSSGWTTIVNGTTVGHKKIDRFAPVSTTRLRVTLTDYKAPPQLRRVALFGP